MLKLFRILNIVVYFFFRQTTFFFVSAAFIYETQTSHLYTKIHICNFHIHVRFDHSHICIHMCMCKVHICSNTYTNDYQISYMKVHTHFLEISYMGVLIILHVNDTPLHNTHIFANIPAHTPLQIFQHTPLHFFSAHTPLQFFRQHTFANTPLQIPDNTTLQTHLCKFYDTLTHLQIFSYIFLQIVFSHTHSFHII